MNNKTNHRHKRCLRIVYSDEISSFEKRLETDRSVPIHLRNLQIFATWFFKEGKDPAPTIFKKKNFSKLIVQYNFQTWKVLFAVQKIWDLVPKELKELSRQLKSVSLKIALVDYVKNTFKISVLFDTFSDIFDIFLIIMF